MFSKEITPSLLAYIVFFNKITYVVCEYTFLFSLKNCSKKYRGGGRARSTLLDTFVGLIKVKVFNVHRRNSIRREMEALGVFADTESTSVSCFC